MIIGYTDLEGDHQTTIAEKARDIITLFEALVEEKKNDESVFFCWAGYQEGEKIVKMYKSR